MPMQQGLLLPQGQRLVAFGNRTSRPWCLCCPPPSSAAPQRLAAPICPLPEDMVVRVAGRTVPQTNLRDDFPGEYPLHFYCSVTGEALPNEATFQQEFRDAMRRQLEAKAPEQYEEFMRTGTCNGRPHGWVLLSITPNQVYRMHMHPGLEMVYIVKGRLHELRLDQALPDFKPVVGEPGPDLSGPGFSFSAASHGAGSWVINEAGSVHQSFTAHEPCLLMAVWPQGYVWFPPERSPPSGVLREATHEVSSELHFELLD